MREREIAGELDITTQTAGLLRTVIWTTILFLEHHVAARYDVAIHPAMSQTAMFLAATHMISIMYEIEGKR